MINKKKEIILFQRLLIWAFYLFSGFLLYFKEANINTFLITFTKVVYPLSVFWLQLRIKGRIKFLPINPSMTTSQLWFNILPVIASLLAIIFSLTNTSVYILLKLTNP